MSKKDISINGKDYVLERKHLKNYQITPRPPSQAVPVSTVVPTILPQPDEDLTSVNIPSSEAGSKNPDIVLLRKIIGYMELRVESMFRPQAVDEETAYALSGVNVIDMLHKFTSNEVITSASATKIMTIFENKIEHILDERGDSPNLIVDLHTHPGGMCGLSEQDSITILKMADVYREHIPGVSIYFGVHAVKPVRKGNRTEPQVMNHKIRWRSHTRIHEVGFFNEMSEPVVVQLAKE